MADNAMLDYLKKRRRQMRLFITLVSLSAFCVLSAAGLLLWREAAILNRCLGLSDTVQPHYYTIDNISKSSPVFLASSGFSLYRPDLFVALNDAADPAVAVHNATELIKEKRGLGCGDAVLLGLRKGVIADG